MVATNTFIKDTVLFVRNLLASNITDPISTSRAGRERFVMTSYPKRGVKYPIITVRHTGSADVRRMGQASELIWVKIGLEIRIWARNEIERDSFTQDVHNTLRSNQYGTGSSVDSEDIHDFKLVSSVPVDIDVGEETTKSQVIEIQYLFSLGS